jgi:hypothetical protein
MRSSRGRCASRMRCEFSPNSPADIFKVKLEIDRAGLLELTE